MNMKDTLTVMAILQEAYPAYYRGKSPDEARAAAALWQNLFAEDAAREVAAAVKAFIATDTKGFPPAIGQIKARLAQLKAPDLPDEAQAWRLVSKAIRNSAYHAGEEFEKLPPVVQKVVGSAYMLHTWAMTSGDSLETVIASNFQRAYRARARDALERLALPSDVRDILERNDPTFALPEAPDPEAQKQNALRRLAESRDRDARRILGDEYDHMHDPREALGRKCEKQKTVPGEGDGL